MRIRNIYVRRMVYAGLYTIIGFCAIVFAAGFEFRPESSFLISRVFAAVCMMFGALCLWFGFGDAAKSVKEWEAKHGRPEND